MTLISVASYAQTIEQKIDQAAKDKKRAENAAKADVIITNNKKKIFDSTETGLNARDYAFEQPIEKKQEVKKQQKKKACKKKRS